MYLETIYILSMKSANVRSVDVSEYMGFSKPSVSRAIGLLKQDGFLTVEPNGNLILTETGRKHAKRIYDRHTTLTEMFVRLGVDEKIAAEDACRVEHYISDATFRAIKNHLKTYS